MGYDLKEDVQVYQIPVRLHKNLYIPSLLMFVFFCITVAVGGGDENGVWD